MPEKKKKEVKQEEVVVNLDSLGVPIAIIIAGIIIASVIFFTSKNNTANPDSDTKDDGIAQDDDTPAAGDVVVTLGDDPFLGDKSKAKAAVVDFSDYGCGYCQRHSQETYPQIKSNYIDTGKILYVFKEFPLSGEGQIGYTTAHAGMCVFELKGSSAFESFHKSAFFTETEAALKKIATGLGVDGAKYDKCMSEKRYTDEIAADREEGSKAGITGTPGFIIGVIGEDGKVTGKLIAGAYPYATFESTINEMLAK